MPDYLVTDSQTGRKFKLTGDSPPTDAELTGIFSAQTESVGTPEPTSNQAADFARRIPEGMATGTGRTIQGLARAADIAQDTPPIPFMGGFGMDRAAQTQIKVNQEIAAANRGRSATRQQRMEESPTYQFGAGTVEAAQGFYGVDRARDDEFVGQLATAAGEMVPTLVTGAFTGPIGAGVQYAASAGESQAQEAIAAGREDVADAAFLAAAGLGGLTEAALGVPGRLLSIINKARKAGVNPGKFGQWANRNPVKSGILRVGAEGGAREAGQEGLEQAGGNLIASDLAGYDPDRPVGQGVGRAMALGGVLGGVLGGGAAGVNQVSRNQQAAQLRTARTVRLTADGREVIVNQETGTTEFGPLENDWLPAPVEDRGETIENRAASPLSSTLSPLSSELTPATPPTTAAPAATAEAATPGVSAPIEFSPFDTGGGDPESRGREREDNRSEWQDPLAAKPTPLILWTATTPTDNVPVQGVWDVVDAGTLRTSFDAGYDQSLQPRDRTRQASSNQIARLAQGFEPQRAGESATTDMGAPIVDELNQVLSGNGRTSAIRTLYGSENIEQAVGEKERSQNYRLWLVQNADRWGVDPSRIRGIERPVLVRRVTNFNGLSKQEFARQSNQQQVLGQSEAEMAGSDARLLTENPQLLDALQPNAEGDVLAASNREFLNGFIAGVGGAADLLTKDGGYTPALKRRVQNAVLGSLIGPENRSLLGSLIERGEELGVKTQVNALIALAPRLARLRGTDFHLGDVLERALADLVRFKSGTETLADFLNQQSLLGDEGRTRETDRMLLFMAEAKSAKEVGDALDRYVRGAQNAIADAQSGGMFGGTPATRADVIQSIYGRQAQNSSTQTGLALRESPPAYRTGQGDPPATPDSRGVQPPAGQVANEGPESNPDIRGRQQRGDAAGWQLPGEGKQPEQSDLYLRHALRHRASPAATLQLQRASAATARKAELTQDFPRTAEGGLDFKRSTVEQVDALFKAEQEHLDALRGYWAEVDKSGVKYPSHASFLARIAKADFDHARNAVRRALKSTSQHPEDVRLRNELQGRWLELSGLSEQASREMLDMEVAASNPQGVGVSDDLSRLIQKDRIETLLDAAEAKLKDTPGAMLEGVTGAPVWMTKAALRGVIQVVRGVYRASKNLALALRAGLEWLRDQNLKGFDEAQAHGWLAKTITEGSSVDGLNIRATSDLLAASPLIPDEVRELIANVTYEVVTDKNATDFANRILDALGDPSAALPILADASNGLGGKRRTVLAFLTLLRLSQAITQAKAAGDTATVQRLADTEAAVYDYTLADRITDAAQTLQAVSVFSKLSPEGRLIHARRRLQRAGDLDLDPLKAQLNDALEKLEKAKKDLAEETARGREIQQQAAQAIADALEAEAQRARTALQNAIHLNASNSLEMLPSVWQKAQAAVLQQWHKLGADELVKNLTGRAGQALENSLWSAVQQKGGAQSTVASVIAQVNRALHEQVNRALNVKPEQFINPATYALRLRHALGNAEVMSRIWEQTRAAVGANLRAIGEMEGLLLRIGEEIALLEASAKLPLEGGPEVTATDAKLRQSQQGARDAMLAGRNAGIAQTIVQKRERLADVEAQLAEYRKMEPAWRAVLAMTVDVWGPNLVRGVMAEQMKADGFRLRKAVSDHFRGLHGAPDPMQSLGTLTAKIVAASGLDEQAAGRLAASIEAEFVAQVEKERAKVSERIKAAAVRKAARAADAPRREAEALIDSLQELQTEWLKPPGKRSAIRALVRQAIRSEPGAQFQDEFAFRNAVQAGLVALGVPEQSAARLAYETWQAKQARDAGREGDRLDQLIRERMAALKLNLGKLVREHWSKVERAGESLAEQLAGEGGLTPEGAQKLATAFERRFNQLAQAKLKRELLQVLKPVTRSAIAKPGLVEKLMGLLRLGAFSNEAYWKAVMERLKLPEFSEALRDRLTAIGARLDALPEADIEGRHRVSVEFLNALEQAAGIDPLDLSLGFYVTNLLTGIPTHVANTSANFFAAIANAGIQMELAIAEGRYDDIPAAIEAAAVGLKKALPQAGQVMRTGILPAVRQGQARALRPMELAQFGTRGGVPLRDTGMVSRSAKWALETYPAKILNLWKLNGRAMAAEDLLAFTPAMEVQRVLLARRVARAEGLRGEALRNRVAGLLADSDPANEEDAREFALRVVSSATPYGFAGAVVNLINQAKGSEHRALRGAANIVAPVLTIPMNAFNESLNYTPVGLWRRRAGVTNLLGRDVKNLSLEQQQDLRAELLAKALTGTLFLTAAALMFAQFLDDDDPALALYGMGPQDPTDNKGWRERGALPHSLKVGNTYFSFALTPIAAPLSALGNLFDGERDWRIYGRKRPASLATQAGVAILSSFDVLFDQPFAVGFVDLFRLAGNTQGSDETKVRSGFRRAAKTASSFVVPNEVRNIDRYFDPKVYPVRDLEGALISSVPFVRGMGGKPALNALGQPIESQPFHRFLSRQAADPLIRGLDAKGAWPTVLDDRNKVWPAKRRAMTEGEFYSYQAETGKALDRKLRAEWPAWSRLPDAIARDKVNEAATKERAIWRSRNGWGKQ